MLFETKAALEGLATIHRNPAHRAWMRLLGQVLRLGEGRAEFLHHGERAWASATFAGTRHSIALSFSGQEAVAAGERLIAALPDHEFDVPGHLVADAAITEVSHSANPSPILLVEMEILLLEDL